MKWKEAKKKAKYYAHIRIVLAGETDKVICRECHEEKDLGQFKTRLSGLLEMARKHFYKHKLGGVKPH